MKTGNLIFYIIGGFVLGILTLVGIEYVTTKNVKELISGNERLLQEFNINNKLIDLQKDLLVLDNSIKNAVIAGDSTKMNDFQSRILQIQEDVEKLKSRNTNDSTKKLIAQLDKLVDQKLRFSNQVADSLYNTDKKAAEKLISTQRGTLLSDSITMLTQKIDTSGQIRLSQTIKSLDRTGNKVMEWNYYIIILVLLLFTFVFWVIISRMKKQADLIGKLNTSEKKLKQAALVKENFLANMSHEIRTPLNAIIGYTNLLQRKSMDQDSKLYVSTVQKSGESLLAIVNDILDLSKIEAGMMRIEETVFSLRGLIHSIEAMFNNKISEKGLTFSSSVEAGTPDTLLGDPTRLTQILVNLIGNSIKFTLHGSISLNVAGHEQDDHSILCAFQISDTGIGIEKDKIGSVFERFSQAEDSTTRKFGGTGLGLSIVRDLIYLQNGQIEVTSKTGSGTEILFKIPYKISNQHFNFDNSDKVFIPKHFNKDLNILIVEDNEINQGLVAHLFDDWRIKHTIVGNGKEALEILPDNTFDLILMDVQMPVMDGYTATQQIRQQLKMNIPIVAMTAHAMPGQREKCISYGMNDHITKPIRENDLWRVITNHVGVYQNNISHEPKTSVSNSFQVIDLTYLKEISNGDHHYEKIVSGQFLELVPQQLETLNEAVLQKNREVVKQTAHNLKTSISIMGLDAILFEHLDALESNDLNFDEMKNTADKISEICNAALIEASFFHESFTFA